MVVEVVVQQLTLSILPKGGRKTNNLEKHNKVEVIHESRNPEILVVTPLLPGHKVSKDTKKTIKRNRHVPYTWISSTGENNIPANVQIGINWYKKKRKKMPYFVLPLDNDIILGRSMLDRLADTLRIQPPNVAYCYANFEFKGHINKKFPAVPFDIEKLLRQNYISSNSLIRLDKLEMIGGMVIDDELVRLLDWALYLKFLVFGFIGVPCTNAHFIAQSKKDDISARDGNDYQLKHKLVHDKFVVPLLKGEKNAQIRG